MLFLIQALAALGLTYSLHCRSFLWFNQLYMKDPIKVTSNNGDSTLRLLDHCSEVPQKAQDSVRSLRVGSNLAFQGLRVEDEGV